MKTLNRRIKALMHKKTLPRQAKLLPLVVDVHTTNAEIERLKLIGRAVFRSGDTALFDEFV